MNRQIQDDALYNDEIEYRTEYKVITFNNDYYTDKSELEKLLNDWWEVINSWVNTIIKERINYWVVERIENIAWFILKKEIED